MEIKSFYSIPVELTTQICDFASKASSSPTQNQKIKNCFNDTFALFESLKTGAKIGLVNKICLDFSRNYLNTIKLKIFEITSPFTMEEMSEGLNDNKYLTLLKMVYTLNPEKLLETSEENGYS